jgi:prepilin-type processing-associated H-X9-DG protein
LPPGRSWADAIRDTVKSDAYHRVFHCPSDTAPAPSCRYALNSALGGGRLKRVSDPAATVLLFESDLHIPNAAGGPEVVAPPRHELKSDGSWSSPKAGNYVFADGHVKALPAVPAFGNPLH